MDTGQGERVVHTRETLEATVRQGDAWLEKLKPELEHLPKGTVVVINCASGEYVTANSRLAGMDKFLECFGDVPGYVHEIGGGLFIGGRSLVDA